MSKQKLYLMKNDFGLYKIGISKAPDRRVSEIRNSSGVGVQLLKVWETKDDAGVIEKMLHLRYKEHRQHGEWFSYIPLKDLETCLVKWHLKAIEKRMIELQAVAERLIREVVEHGPIPVSDLTKTKWGF